MSSQKVAICQKDDLPVGQMQQFTAAHRDVLLARLEDGFLAMAAHCAHYGAPLEKGVLSQGRVVCPWHNACYSLESGSLLEPPGRNNLTRYRVEVEADTVYVEVPLSDVQVKSDVFVEVSTAKGGQVLPPLATYDPQSDHRTFVIVGGGAAGSAAAEMLRQAKFQGRIVILSADDEPPYDRTALSKAYLQSEAVEAADALRPADFYPQHGIELKTSAPVTQLNVEAQQLTYGAGETLGYDALLLATGGKVQRLSIPGADLANIFTLRDPQDAKQVLETAHQAQRAVVVGAGFIGMEVASSLRQQGLDVTVVAPGEVPFEKVLGRAVGQRLHRVHEAHGVQFELGAKATAFRGNTAVEAVELDTGKTLAADLVIVGIGVKPATAFIQGLELNKDGSLAVDQYLQAAPNIYAAGDIAQFPHPTTGQPVRLEHWRVALQQGRIAACNMAGQKVPFKAVPFFWTGQFDLKLRYVGHAESWDDVIIQGSLEDKTFLAFYVQEQRILAVTGLGRDRDIAAISELMRLGQMPTADQIRQTEPNWVALLQP